MTATIKREWTMGLPSGFWFVLRGLKGNESLLNGTPMGRTQQDAKESLAEINSRRYTLKLEPITV